MQREYRVQTDRAPKREKFCAQRTKQYYEGSPDQRNTKTGPPTLPPVVSCPTLLPPIDRREENEVWRRRQR